MALQYLGRGMHRYRFSAPRRSAKNTRGTPGGGFGRPFASQESIDAAIAAGTVDPAAFGPAAPGQPQDAGGDAPDVRDAQYWAAKAMRDFLAQQKRQELDRTQAYDTTDLHETLRRMSLQRPQDEQAAKEAANRQGLLFSGYLGKNLGDIGTGYARRQSDLQQAFDRRQAARDAARAAIDQGAPLEDAVAMAGAADRQIAGDQQAAADNALVPNPGAPAPAATGTKTAVASRRAVTTTGYNQKRRQRFSVVRRGGTLFHRYAGGRDVRVG